MADSKTNASKTAAGDLKPRTPATSTKKPTPAKTPSVAREPAATQAPSALAGTFPRPQAASVATKSPGGTFTTETVGSTKASSSMTGSVAQKPQVTRARVSVAEKPKASRSTPKQSTPGAAEVEQMIAEAAYYLAEKRNFAPGFEVEDWAAATAEVMARVENSKA